MQSLGRAAFVAATDTLLLACGTGTDQAGQGQSPPAAAQSVRKNACDLVDRAAIEGIAGRTLEMLRQSLAVHERHREGLQQEVQSRTPLMNLSIGDDERVDEEPAPTEGPEETAS